MPYLQYHEGHKIYLDCVCKRIQQAIYEPIAQLDTTVWVTREPVPFGQRQSGKKKHLKIGQKWGKVWDCGWFHFTGKVPTDAAGKNLVLLIDVNGEACVVDKKGNPVLGLTSVKSPTIESLGKPGKKVVELISKANGNEKVDLWVDASCNSLFGDDPVLGTLLEAHIAVFHKPLYDLFYDFAVLNDLLKVVPETKGRHHTILDALTRAARELFDYTPQQARKARKILAPELAKNGGDPSFSLSAVGNAHLDLAWLWPIRETIRKGTRTFATALHLMNKYPDYVFGASQAQLYQWIKDRYPELYQKVKQRIRQGRWELHGAMWVEADVNISGGEALVRQILYGQQFFQREFGRTVDNMWLPDAFGFSAALPQLCKKSGLNYFLTTKMAWNAFNKFPHHTFIWHGIDNSAVLVHMPPDFCYSSSAAPQSIDSYEKTYRDKMVCDRALLLFGIGDGGGGPGEEHLEALKREKNLSGIAPVMQEPAAKFFERINKNRNRYKSWTGTLYLEKHQGTFTTQSRNKWYNRKMEIALRELEWVASLASICTDDYEYPQDQLETIWKEVLLYQFHDILPGSSITRVYDECLKRYEILLSQTHKLTRQARKKLTEMIITRQNSLTGQPVIVMNSLSWDRRQWLKIARKWLYVHIPAMGYSLINPANSNSGGECTDNKNNPDTCQCKINTNNSTLLENDILRIRFARDGAISSLYDKQLQREVIAPNAKGNQLHIYEDIVAPADANTWGHENAWDFPVDYDQKKPWQFKLQSCQSLIDGPRAILRQKYTFGKSQLIQDIIITAHSRRIDFKTMVNWREDKKMLRTSFPVNILANQATCDIQFGNIKYPTHRNTSQDMARFEVCAHKWVDISQPDYGVALLNDCKYGHKLLGNTLDLALLRSTGFPDQKADRARHEFTYSLYPHPHDCYRGQVIKAAYELNIPLQITPLTNNANPDTSSRPTLQTASMPTNSYATTQQHSFIRIDNHNIIIETIKKAQDNNDLIIRLYESYGQTTTTKLHLNIPAQKAVSANLVNLMEQQPAPLKLHQQILTLHFKPFEIHTVRIKICHSQRV